MSDDKPKQRRLTVLLDAELHRKARRKSVDTDTPMAKVVREALRRWVEDDPPEPEDTT